VLADTHGNVIVVGTRDCSLQRRNQKLVEEAPAPFLTDDQRSRIHESAKAICAEAGYHGAGTVEYLVGADGSISFLEVNTRLQVEHPVSEETSGLDLVRQQFRIADGEELTLTEDPEPRGHSIEFRINAEDAGRNFMPAPGPVQRLEIPQGPGVRWDSGVETGGEVAGAFDSMLAKLIITGATRAEALQRARRALDELVVEGMPTVIPFHRAVVRDEAFTSEPFTVHTRWIETEWDNQVPPYDAAPSEAEEAAPRQTVVVEVGGRRLEVSLPAGLAAGGGGAAAGAPAKPRKRGGGHGGSAASGDSLTSPMQGTIVKVAVEDGATVAAGDLVVVLEAMKMEQPIAAHKAGTVTGLSAEVGASVTSGAVICTIADAE
jgi:acetyl-CoA/propionyl-CoA carboxylase biotin carboxyl carrier protein